MFNSLVGTQTPNYKIWNLSGITSSTARPKIGLEDDCPTIQYILGGGQGQYQITLPSAPAPGKVITIVFQYNVNNTGAIPRLDIYAPTTPLSLVTAVGAGQTVTLIYAPDAVVYAPNANGAVKWIPINGMLNAGSSATTYGYASGAALSGYFSSAMGTGATCAGGVSNTAQGVYPTIGGGALNYASGNGSVIAGGVSNIVAGSSATISGGQANVSYSGTYVSIGGGYSNDCNAWATTIAGGENNGVTAMYGTVGGGQNNNVDNSWATIAGGYNNYALGEASFISGGVYGTTRGVTGLHAFPACNAPITSVNGVSQAALLIVARQTADATPIVATSNSSTSVASNNQLFLPLGSAYFVRGSAVAYNEGTNDAKQWTFECLIKNDSLGVTSIVGVPTVVSTFADTGAASWTLSIAADTANTALSVTVTGGTDPTPVRFVCRLDSVEAAFN